MRDDKRLRRKVRRSYIVSTISISMVLFLLGSVGYMLASALTSAHTLRSSITLSVELDNKLAAIELSQYIIAKLPKNRYSCEFHSIEKFIGNLMAMEADYRLVEPEWLRDRLIRCANRVIRNHRDQENTEE
jgi:hypothetical protein